MHGVISSQVQDFALPCAAILVHLFLQPVVIPVNGSPVLQLSFLLYCSYLAESAFESAFSLIVQVVKA